jgi:hypothetical protein
VAVVVDAGSNAEFAAATCCRRLSTASTLRCSSSAPTAPNCSRWRPPFSPAAATAPQGNGRVVARQQQVCTRARPR